MTRRQTLWVKLSSYAQWFLDDDYECRLPILFVWVVAVPLICGATFLWFNTPWSVFAQTGLSFVTAGVLIAIAAVISFLMREEM